MFISCFGRKLLEKNLTTFEAHSGKQFSFFDISKNIRQKKNHGNVKFPPNYKRYNKLTTRMGIQRAQTNSHMRFTFLSTKTMSAINFREQKKKKKKRNVSQKRRTRVRNSGRIFEKSKNFRKLGNVSSKNCLHFR